MRKKIGFQLSGCEYCQNQIHSLLHEDPLYDVPKAKLLEALAERPKKFIGRYKIEAYPAMVRSEPEMWPDPGALSVYAEGLLLGYIPPSHFRQLLEAADKPRPYMWVRVGYGHYKTLSYNAEADKERTYDAKYFHLKVTKEDLAVVFCVSWDEPD